MSIKSQVVLKSLDKSEPILLYTQQKPCEENCEKTIDLFERKNHMQIKVTHSFENLKERRAVGH